MINIDIKMYSYKGEVITSLILEDSISLNSPDVTDFIHSFTSDFIRNDYFLKFRDDIKTVIAQSPICQLLIVYQII